MLLFITLFKSNANTNDQHHTIDSLLQIFDKELLKRDEYVSQKNIRVAELKTVSELETDIEKKILINERIFLEYKFYKYDSALYYLNRNINLLSDYQNPELNLRNKLHLCDLYIRNGVFWEVRTILNGLDFKSYTPAEKRQIIETESRFYFYLFSTATTQINREKYRNRVLDCGNRLWENGFQMHEIHPEIQLFLHYLKGDRKKLISVCDSVIQWFPKESSIFHIVYDWKAVVAEHQGNTYENAYNLVMASIYQQRNCILNARPTYELTNFLFQYDIINRAYKYNQRVQEDANISNSYMHQARSSKLTEMINKRYEGKINLQKKRLYYYLLTISLLSIGLIIIVCFLINHMRRLACAKQAQSELNDQLDKFNRILIENNKIKEQYIGVFLQLKPDYIESLNEYRKTVLRFVKEKRIADLYEFCKSERNIDEEYEKSQLDFDKMFLHIYPDFIKEFNALLCEEARCVPKNGALTLEMRIYALIRLGVTDSTKIARYLHYSVNTIYNYRSRVKQKAIVPKDDFENRVKKIGTRT